MSEQATKFHARMDLVLELLGTNIKDLARHIKMSKDTLYSMRSSGRTPSFDFLFAFKSKYPIVNLDYLISGLGKPLLGVSEYIKVESKPSQANEQAIQYAMHPENYNVLRDLVQEWLATNNAMLEFFQSNTPQKV